MESTKSLSSLNFSRMEVLRNLCFRQRKATTHFEKKLSHFNQYGSLRYQKEYSSNIISLKFFQNVIDLLKTNNFRGDSSLQVVDAGIESKIIRNCYPNSQLTFWHSIFLRFSNHQSLV